jgi:hypothetical protein
MKVNLKFSLFISLIVSVPIAHAVCEKPYFNPKYPEIQKDVETRVQKFANHNAIATQADQMLSQLIAKKSPAIIGWMNKRDFKSKSEDQIALEWRDYYARSIVIGSYKKQDPKIRQSIVRLFEEINEKHFNSQFKAKLEKLLEEVKKAANKTLLKFKLAKESSDQISSRLSSVKLYWMDRFPGSKFEDMPLEWLSWGVAYDPKTNEINVGLDAFKYKSESSLFAVLAHELTHSFDPCRWGAYLSGPFPFESVVSCLRSDQSINAKPRDDLKLEKSGLPAELVSSLKQNRTCNKKEYPPIGIQSDQIPEAFADWFSAEVVSQSSYMDQDLRSDLCEQIELNSGSSYPRNKDRLERVYLAHPEIRKKLSLTTPPTHYCSFNI